MKFAIATNQNGEIQYLREEAGQDCYTDDIGNAILAEEIEQLPKLLLGEYHITVDDSDGLAVIDS